MARQVQLRLWELPLVSQAIRNAFFDAVKGLYITMETRKNKPE